ncbi:MAG TPA: TIR domain-containing protein [Chthoniobacterales bacterium]|nr:TIR domain-containing protein [Chthoniobacterales bacterium]
MTEAEHPAIRELNALNPDAVALAELVSFAVLVDSQLLRQARLALTLPGVDAGAEADVWLSSLVQSRSPEGILFFLHAAKALRKRLANKPERLTLARKITRSRYERLLPAVAVEEEINCLSVNPDDQAFAHIERLLQSAAATLLTDDTRSGLAHWAARVWPRLPAAVRQMEPARVLAMAAYLRLGEQLPADEAEVAQTPESAGSQIPDWMAWALPKDLPRDSIGIKLVSNGIEFAPPREGDHVIELPATTPLLLEVSWTQNNTSYFEKIHWCTGERRLVKAPPGEIRLRTISGERYAIVPSRVTPPSPAIPQTRRASVFISSSRNARDLALHLKDRLEFRDSDLFEIQLWWDDALILGKSTLEGLIDHCQETDFAAVLLTEDDPTEKKGVENVSLRDNCVFELGLFTGALGPNPQRVFQISSAKAAALPSDVEGITNLQIVVERKEDGELTQECKDSIDRAAGSIASRVKKLRSYVRGVIPLISGEELMDFERIRAEGNLDPGSHIVITAEQPLEKDPDFAIHVQANMREGIRYSYFFFADENSANVIARLIQALAAVGVPGETVYERRDNMMADQEKVTRNLETMQQHLAIHFTALKPAFQLRIHNADLVDKAVCFLRFTKEKSASFVRWCEEGPAKRVADHLLRMRRPMPKGIERYIFRSTSEFDFDATPDFKENLCDEILELFPQPLDDKAKAICFGK